MFDGAPQLHVGFAFQKLNKVKALKIVNIFHSLGIKLISGCMLKRMPEYSGNWSQIFLVVMGILLLLPFSSIRRTWCWSERRERSVFEGIRKVTWLRLNFFSQAHLSSSWEFLKFRFYGVSQYLLEHFFPFSFLHNIWCLASDEW